MGKYLQERGFTVLGVRLAGHGTTAEDMSHMTDEDWMDSVRDGYAVLAGCTESISVVGHSMGGLFALLLAAEEQVSRIVTLAAPIVIAKDVRYETVIEIETRSMMLPGMEIEIGTKRVYPRSTLASQIIGYTGAIPSRAMWLTLQAKGYSYNDTIGRDGIESSMEDWLTQNSSLRKGARVVERDQMSKVVRELSYTEPQDGNNVKLTLNAAYQAVAERAIADNVNSTRDLQERYLASDSWLEANKTDIHNRNWSTYPLDLAEHGCLVVLDMQCRVLALANYPTYDLNALVAGGKEAMAILGDSRNLLLPAAPPAPSSRW